MIPFIIAAVLLNQILGNPTPVGSEAQINISKRIVDGRMVLIYKHPWMAAIEENDSVVCGGTILSDRVILTAAHCTTSPRDILSVRVGSSAAGYGGSKHRIVEMRRHEYFTSHDGRNENDVALVKVSPPFEFGGTVANVILSNKDYVVLPGTAATIAGWGSTSETSPSSSMLKSASVLIVDTMKCAKTFEKYFDSRARFSGQICAAAPGRDACDGDSGGPLMQGRIQIGIVSWGKGCALPEYPGVYMDITFYRDWIDKNFQDLDPRKSSYSYNSGDGH